MYFFARPLLTLSADNLPETGKRQLEKPHVAHRGPTSCASHQAAKRFAVVEKLAKSDQNLRNIFYRVP
jgi:hypothetical protein